MAALRRTNLEDSTTWYKDAIIYEVHVRSFYDSNDDGIGDFRGLTEKLGYLEDLGVTAIWLLPFYPSPLKDDGYDIADYFNIHPEYGTLRDFREFLKQAHQRGIGVITELVLNHTSDQHPWFQRARRAKPGSARREFYVWSDTPEKYQEARIIFKDFETSNWTWDPLAKAYYWHRFYSHQPDLNYDNPHVQEAMLRVLDFWLGLGVDGLRLDAVPYLYEREGTNCENLPETYAYLRKLRAHIDGQFNGRMLLAEANQWPEDAAAYFGAGDECHMAFHFPLMPRIFMASRMEDRFPIIDILEQTPAIPELCQWALFLRNHDELTLEMVTDEERDYMYRVYAEDPRARINLGIRRRLAPLLGNNRRKIELMNILLFSLPGTPILYYGDEIGMGDNYYLGDRNGVRTPMQWGPDRNAGFSKANPQKLYLPVIIDPEYHYEAVNVETQERNLSSPLWWMKRVIAMRKRCKAFGRGSLEFLSSSNPKVLAFVRQYQNEIILVVVNLSRFSQVAEIDLSKYAGSIPEEVFSQNKFPAIKESPYVLTLGPYDHHWLRLERERAAGSIDAESAILEYRVRDKWKAILGSELKERLEEEILPEYLKRCAWFGERGRSIRRIKILDSIAIAENSDVSQLAVVKIDFIEGSPNLYLWPLSFATQDRAKQVVQEFPQGILARLRAGDVDGVLYESIYDEEFRRNLLTLIARRRRLKGSGGELVASRGREFLRVLPDKGLPLVSQLVTVGQRGPLILYDNTYVLRLYRRLDEGINPNLEIVKPLTEKLEFSHVPPFAGAIEYKRRGFDSVAIGVLQGFVPNQGDAWTYTVDVIGRYFERVLVRGREAQQVPEVAGSFLTLDPLVIPPLLLDLIGGIYLEIARLLGQRTGELHRALASLSDDASFAPEPFTMLYQRSLYQSMRGLTRRVLQSLEKNLKRLPDSIHAEAVSVLASEPDILNRLQRILRKKIAATKMRIHGDYHLGQVLYTGKDFVIINFEGLSARAWGERRLKHSPLRDVASMLRSFQYAAHSALFLQSSVRPEDRHWLEPWADRWYYYVGGVFLQSYLDTTRDARFLPADREGLEILLHTLALERAIYELGHDLTTRPDGTIIPIKGIKAILKNPS